MKRDHMQTMGAETVVPSSIANAYQAKMKIPCAVLGIRTESDALVGLDFLAVSASVLAPSDDFTRMVCAQIATYIRDPDFVLNVPLRLTGTVHQRKVWQALCTIPRGSAWTYGALAQQLGSSPRAIGGACGDNPIPLFIPCHRVVAKHSAGGFMHHASGAPLTIKTWLLRHEGWQR